MQLAGDAALRLFPLQGLGEGARFQVDDEMHRLFELLLEQRLALLERHRRLGRQFQSLLPSEGEQVRRGQHPVGEPETQRLFSIDGLCQQQQLRRLEVTYGAWQQQAGGKLRHQSQLDERQLQPGVVSQIDQVAVQQQGSADADCRAAHGGDHRFGEVGQGVQKLQDGIVRLKGVLANKVGQIVAGGEALRLALQQQRVLPGDEGQRTLQFFADRVEGNLLAAHQEIQKLALLYPAGELNAAQIESAVLNVARYDVFKLGEAVLGGRLQRVQRMLDGLQAEGESEVMVLYALAEDIRALRRVRRALDAGRPLPLALREQRIWGHRERLFERVLPNLQAPVLAQLLHAAHVVDGIVKGIRTPGWPAEGWQALHRLAISLASACACGKSTFALTE